MGEKYEYLKKVLDDSHYTVALCGSGILAETGCRTFQNQDYAYEIEQKYGRSPEDIFASAYYMTRPDSFFEFYRAEVLEKDWKPSESCYALKKLEDAGKIQCILSDNIFDLEKRAGCTGSDRSRKSRSASFARNKIIFGCVLKLCQIF